MSSCIITFSSDAISATACDAAELKVNSICVLQAMMVVLSDWEVVVYVLVVFGDLKEDLDSMFGNDVCVAFVKIKDN